MRRVRIASRAPRQSKRFERLRSGFGLLRVGETAHLEVIRDSETRTIEVLIGEAETTG
jgi:S1-C subfamily serine protease